MRNSLRWCHPLENHPTTTARARKGRNRLTRRSPEAMVHLHPSSRDRPCLVFQILNGIESSVFVRRTQTAEARARTSSFSRLQPGDLLTATAPFDQIIKNRTAALWTAGVNTGRPRRTSLQPPRPIPPANICPRKETAVVGCDVGLVFGHPDATQTISAKHQVNRIDYHVFEGFTCLGSPRTRAKSHGMKATCGPRPVAGNAWRATRARRNTFCAPRRIDGVDVTL
jgi:hypothetical protein